MSESGQPLVGIIMGSTSDWETMKPAVEMLKEFDISYDCRVMSAHRTPALVTEFASDAEGRGMEVLIAESLRARGHGVWQH